jgi:predicted Rossmann-fold nucleotide-binding protein
LFAAGAVYYYLYPGICGTANEMFVMWIIMAVAHVSPWIMYLEQRRYRKIQHFPHKQQ